MTDFNMDGIHNIINKLYSDFDIDFSMVQYSEGRIFFIINHDEEHAESTMEDFEVFLRKHKPWVIGYDNEHDCISGSFKPVFCPKCLGLDVEIINNMYGVCNSCATRWSNNT